MIKSLTFTLVIVVMLTGAAYPNVAFGEIRDGIDVEQRLVKLALVAEPRSLNPLSAESVSYTAGVLVLVSEGLMRYDARRRLVGGVAESWQVNEARITFRLREDAHWQTGEPVTAHDFVRSFRLLVSPRTASPSAFLASPIKNAQAITRGDMAEEELGVKATGDRELIVELEHPCAWCLKLMTSSMFYPVHGDVYKEYGDGYGASIETHVANGAYQILDWQRGKRLRLVKNEHYWRRHEVDARQLHFDYLGQDAKTNFNLFRSGELAIAGLDRDSAVDAAAEGYRIRTYPTGHLYYLQFSHREELLSATQEIRQAVALTIDRQELVDRVVAMPGTRVATSMFHDWLRVGDQVLLESYPAPAHQTDLDEARGLVDKIRIQSDSPLELVLTISDSTTVRRTAEYIQQRLLEALSIRVKIDPQTVAMMVQKWREGSSDMTLLSWPVDVEDPIDQIAFMGNPESAGVFKGFYRGDDLVALYESYRDATAVADRLSIASKVDALFRSKVTVLPLYEVYSPTLVSPALKGYVRQPVRGFDDYRYLRFR